MTSVPGRYTAVQVSTLVGSVTGIVAKFTGLRFGVAALAAPSRRKLALYG